ncbi:hypothetical protein [Loigolactobacillus jiayinensis]|uniref:DUF4365 domain-containing protein n=1 Tax=Loigolactobacillus jiayinensis TaxID=2486016 RepID=A0ABW1RHQ9_9LACO|nr:hypothetical protein [Loigolactobacillus jiayinensis]
MKTKQTLAIEQALYAYCSEKGYSAVEEVTLPDDLGIVDMVALRTDEQQQQEWRCYELKISKADFHSTARLSFVGHYNYFVLTAALYTQVATKIPPHIGVLLYHPFKKGAAVAVPGYLTVAKAARRQELLTTANVLTTHFMLALAREAAKFKQANLGLAAYSTERLYAELRKRGHHYDPSQLIPNYYETFIKKTRADAVTQLKAELAATEADYQQLLRRYHQVSVAPSK